METLLIYFVIALGIIAIVQMMRVHEVARELKGTREENISLKDNKLMGGMMLVFIISFFIYVIYYVYSYKDKMLPPSASIHGDATDWLLNFNFVIIFLIFFVTHAVLFWFCFKYYYREDRKAYYYTHNNKLELIWTLIPAVVLAVIIFYGLKTWHEVLMVDAPEDATVIELYSRQFDWTARYSGKDNQLGAANYKLIEGANFLGLDSTDKRVNDDIIVKGEFHLPVGKAVKFMFRSQDVIHSAYMPHFRLQMNTVPGMTTTFHMVPKTTTEEMRKIVGNPEFNYILFCNKICGASHYNMQMDIIIESQEDYEKWLGEQATFIVDSDTNKEIEEEKTALAEIQ